MPEGEKQSPDYEKLRQFSKKRPGHSARSSRKQSTQVTSTVMSCLETTGTAAERLCAHAADAAAGLAHTGLALGAAPAGRRPLANTQSTYATGGTTTTRSLGSACGRRHALFQGQLQLVDRCGSHVLAIASVGETVPFGRCGGGGCAGDGATLAAACDGAVLRRL